MKEEARKFLEKAERTLRAAETLSRVGDYESAAGRSYYAMLHAAQALLRERDLRYRKHAGVHGADYDIDSSFERDATERRLKQAREFLDAARTYLELQG